MKATGSFNHDSFCFLVILPEGHAFCDKKTKKQVKIITKKIFKKRLEKQISK